ncbi:MAG: hypothetical protein ACK4K9_03965 [Bacteroidia bacterium]
MKRIEIVLAVVVFFMVSCGNSEKPLSKTEEQAVQNQIELDEAAMDSLEKAIQAQLDSANFDASQKED